MFNRPPKQLPIEKQKPVLLIGGPPGCGKTSLARVIAAHAGYQYYELNCSLTESPTEFIHRIQNVLSIHTVSGKPLCLILDQLQAIDKQTAKEFLKIISVKTRRPIIAVTNDTYVQPLKYLKTCFFTLKCRTISIPRLKEKLISICRTEGLRISDFFIRELIEETNSDIRSCINDLQMVAAGNNGTSQQLFRMKNSFQSIFEVWRSIFSRQNTMNIRRTVLNYGDCELVNAGIYELYTQATFNDYFFDKTVDLLDSLAFVDQINRRMLEFQQYELYPFQSVLYS